MIDGIFAPRECCELFRNFSEDKYEQALQMQRKFVRADRSITDTLGIPGLKAAMTRTNYFGGDSQLPLLPLNDQEKNDLHSILSIRYCCSKARKTAPIVPKTYSKFPHGTLKLK